MSEKRQKMILVRSHEIFGSENTNPQVHNACFTTPAILFTIKSRAEFSKRKYRYGSAQYSLHEKPLIDHNSIETTKRVMLSREEERKSLQQTHSISVGLANRQTKLMRGKT
jgi:hypothetical protein